MQRTLLAFVEDADEDLKLWRLKQRWEEARFAVCLSAPEIETHPDEHGYPAAADARLSDANGQDFCDLLIPGGFMPDKLKRAAT